MFVESFVPVFLPLESLLDHLLFLPSARLVLRPHHSTTTLWDTTSHSQGRQRSHSYRNITLSLIIPSIGQFHYPPQERAQLQHDVLCSGWWNINRFHAIHLFLFRHHLLSFRTRLNEPQFLISPDQRNKLDEYIRRFDVHWSRWVAPRERGAEDFPLILPWKSMPSCHFFISTYSPALPLAPVLEVSSEGSSGLTPPVVVTFPPLNNVSTREACDITLSQHAFIFRRAWSEQECWNILRVNEGEPEEISRRRFFQWLQSRETLENVKADSKGRQYFLPPRPLLTPPFTAKKRGILVYLIQEAGGRCFITDTPYLSHNSTRADDEKILHRAILEAIPLGDIPFLKILLIMLQGQSPPHLSADPSFTGELISSASGSQDRPMVQLYLEKASWSQENMDEYVLTAMRSGDPEVLSVLLDIYAVYDKRMDDVERFEERMCELLWQSMEQARDSHDRIRDVVVRKVKSLKASVCDL